MELKIYLNEIFRNIISEIIQTEKAYVQDLFTCLDVSLNIFKRIFWSNNQFFFLFLKKYLKELKVNQQQVPENLKGKESIVFGNMEEIYNFHKKYFI